MNSQLTVFALNTLRLLQNALSFSCVLCRMLMCRKCLSNLKGTYAHWSTILILQRATCIERQSRIQVARSRDTDLHVFIWLAIRKLKLVVQVLHQGFHDGYNCLTGSLNICIWERIWYSHLWSRVEGTSCTWYCARSVTVLGASGLNATQRVRMNAKKHDHMPNIYCLNILKHFLLGITIATIHHRIKLHRISSMFIHQRFSTAKHVGTLGLGTLHVPPWWKRHGLYRRWYHFDMDRAQAWDHAELTVYWAVVTGSTSTLAQ